jgi:hypothetical protein
MDEVTRLALEQAWEDGYKAALNNEAAENVFTKWIENPYRRN